MVGEMQSVLELAKDIGDTIRSIGNHTTPALTAYTKKTNIMSRLYVEQPLASEDIILPLIGSLQQLYCCYILTALHLDTFCANGRTVRETFALVASEAQQSGYYAADLVAATFGEAELDRPIKSCAIKTISNEAASGVMVDLEKDSQRLIAGRLIEIDLVIPNADPRKNDGTFKAYLYVQLVPYVLTTSVCTGFLNVNFVPSLGNRFRQMRAGEISFIRDFCFARDLIKKQKDTLRKDTDGVLYDMLIKQRNSLAKWFLSVFGMIPENHNTANSILVLERSTFKKACDEVKVDFNCYAQRQKFFQKTFTMIVVVVDPMYGQVEMYFNGVDVKGTYTFKMIEAVGAKGKKDINYQDVMLAFNQQMSPKF